MKNNLLLIAALGTLLGSCSCNSNNKVKKQTIEEIAELKKEVMATSSSTAMSEPEKTTYTETKISYKEWKFWNPKDEFGDINENMMVITLKLDAIRPNYEEEREHITIDYMLSKNQGECFIFSSSEMGNYYSDISFKMKDGSQIDFSGKKLIDNLRGFVAFYDIDDIKHIAEILNNGNFKLKVGNRVAKVTNETRGFRESVEKYFKGEDIEVLQPLITRE